MNFNRHYSKEDIQMTNTYLKKMLNVTYQKNANQIHSEISSHTYQDGSYKKKPTKDNCWLGCGEIGTLAHCGNVKWCSHYRKQYRDCSGN